MWSLPIPPHTHLLQCIHTDEQLRNHLAYIYVQYACVCTYLCMYVCIFVCLYVCTYVAYSLSFLNKNFCSTVLNCNGELKFQVKNSSSKNLVLYTKFIMNSYQYHTFTYILQSISNDHLVQKMKKINILPQTWNFSLSSLTTFLYIIPAQ